ncbi:MAG: hypothetical protein ACT4PX_02310 [Actinomycetota bacterium]
MSGDRVRATLGDEHGGEEPFARTAETLVASLTSRLAALLYVSGFEAVGSQIAGFAAAGRQVAQTAEGRRLRDAIVRSRAGMNGDALWGALRVQEWLSKVPPSPVLNDIANDLALLLSPGMHEALHDLATGELPLQRVPLPPPEDVTFADTLLGVWAVGRRLADAVEQLVGGIEAGPTVVVAPTPDPGDGSLLR